MANNEPDMLAQEAAAALAAGMTYGKWKGLQYEQAKNRESQRREKEIPEGWLICQHCGKPFKPKTKRKQFYCEVSCQVSAARERDKEKLSAYKRAWAAKKKEGTTD